jgi:dipeptidyl aminopeptidase/acylaminoacyl peptidase
VFFWLHGLDATVDYFEPLLRAWAGAGYLVVAPTFPRTSTGAPGGTDYDDYVHQPADVSFAIDQLVGRYGPAGTVIPGLVTGTDIAVGGHSLGAVTALGLTSDACCLDRRVSAAIAVDGARLAFPDGGQVTSSIPLLVIHGDADTTFSLAQGRTVYDRAGGPKFFAVLRGAPHTPFRIPVARNAIVTLVVDFLDAFVLHQPDALRRMVDDARTSGIATLTAPP